MAQRFQPLQPYKILKEHQSSTSELITWHFTNIVESIHRKLTLRQNFRDPFTVKITIIIFRNLFYQAYRSLQFVITPPNLASSATLIKTERRKLLGTLSNSRSKKLSIPFEEIVW